MSKRIDLLEGNIFSSLTNLALPIMLTSLIQMAYNLTDMAWIGRVGSGAVAAVGAGGMFVWLSQSLATLARMGGQVKAGHCLGAGDRTNATLYAQNALQMGTLFGVGYGLLMLMTAGPLVGFFGLSEAVTQEAKVYLYITGGLVVFTTLNQIFTGLITATGNSRTPFQITTAGLVFNIVFDPLFIFGFGPVPAMGVAGAAIATVLAQALVMLLFIRYARSDDHLLALVRVFAPPSKKHMKDICVIGLPTALQGAFFTIISILISRIVAGWGDAAIAVNRVGSQIESLSWMTADGFAAAVNSFIAQNYGAKNYERAKKGYRAALAVISGWGVVTTLLLVFLAKPIFSLFIPETAIIPLGVHYLVILGYSQLFMCVEIVAAGAFGGFGKTLPPSLVSILFTAARIPMAMVLSKTVLGLNGVWWTMTITSIIKGVLMALLLEFFLHKAFGANKKNKDILESNGR